METQLKYHRVLLKVSGEGLSGTGGFGISSESLEVLSKQILELHQMGVQVAVVTGAGNLLRGSAISESTGIQRATADQMGMLATAINCLALGDCLESQGASVKVLSASQITSLCEPFKNKSAIEYLASGHIVILAGGTGNPFLTTDTCAALRAAEIQADLIVKATKVDGVYNADPMKDASAKMYEKLSFTDVINQDLKVMDVAAIAMCRQSNIDVVVCNLMKQGTVCRVVQGEAVGTLISNQS